jgi:hypothetical protein
MTRVPRPALELLVLLLLPMAACYQYVPLQSPSPAMSEGTPVRVHLGTPRSFDVSGYTAHDVHRVDGSLVQRTEGEWVVAATAMYAAGGARFDPASFALTVPAGDIDTVEVRKLSWWRTVVSAVGVGVGIFLASEAIQGTSSSGNGGGPDPGRAVIPVP